jgi:carboxymethylenebutenolidase
VTFRSGRTPIKGYLARPRAERRYPAVIILHGNPGIPDDIRNAAAQLAQAGMVALAVDWGSRAPMPEAAQEQEKWRERITSYGFWTLVLGDVQSAIGYLRGRPFVRPGGVGLVGFCGGGKQAFLFAAGSGEVKALVVFYAGARERQWQHKTDPRPELMGAVKNIKVPVQGHYGLRDKVALAGDARDLEAALRARGNPVEMYYYEKAGHSFYNFTRPPGSDPGFDFCPAEAALARERMVKFLKRYLS